MLEISLKMMKVRKTNLRYVSVYFASAIQSICNSRFYTSVFGQAVTLLY